MSNHRGIHPDFLFFLQQKDQQLIDLFTDLRSYILDLYPESNELLYHTHALSALFSVSEKMSDGFCMIPIYSNHFNLAFNKGTLLEDPHKLLVGTGKWMRHIPIHHTVDYRNDHVGALIKSSIALAVEDLGKPPKSVGKTISKIKISR